MGVVGSKPGVCGTMRVLAKGCSPTVNDSQPPNMWTQWFANQCTHDTFKLDRTEMRSFAFK